MESSSGIADAQVIRPAAFAPFSSRSEHNQPLRQRGRQRLEDLIDQAERDNFYGTVGVEVTFERGRIILVRHTVNGTDKQ